MPILKCKICGGDMEVSPDKSFGTCEYCGTTMTLPKIDDEQRAAAFNRGNHFRRTGEFDKALQVYERIITEDPNDAEAHWCCALCRYGIEWVEDPATMEYLPTCHRASFDIFTDDIDCKAAIELSDGVTKRQYQKDAVKIADVQKGILLTSQKEEPFDVFICYKETDENGNRTVDSTLAQDVYYQLSDKGLRVFFARITLEDKAGSQYEPYIFAALHSAKVMVVIGTRPEYFSAVWVKNEWSRFLSLVKKDHSKALLPCYKDMDPYDLPEQLAVLQSYDMSKIGFIQDLIRGIEKIAKADKPKAAVKETVVLGGDVNVAPLLKRAFIFLEDGNWQEADEYCEKVLDQDPENAQAYLGKLMAELQVKKQENLKDAAQPFDQSNNYQKILRFGDDAIKGKLKNDIAYINERNEIARKTGIYNDAVKQMNAANSEAVYQAAAKNFGTIPGFKDADELTKKCLEKAEECRKDVIYQDAVDDMASKTIIGYRAAINRFQTIPGWKNADGLVVLCQKNIEEIKAKVEADRQEAIRKAEEKRIADEKAAKKCFRIAVIVLSIIIVVTAVSLLLVKVIIPNAKYNSAISLIEAGKYVEAYEALKDLNGYKDSTEKAVDIYAQYKAEKWKTATVGDTIFFGSYEQDNNTSNGKEDIEWLVLAKDGDKALIISKYALDCQPYNTSYTKVTWETCSLRKWLNGIFLDNSFSATERNQIQKATVTADKNPSYSTSPGNNTTDKVFLLSITEANKYFSSDEARKCAPTEYAKAQGAWTSTRNGNCSCWLRSPGDGSARSATVDAFGSVNNYGCEVYINDEAVRPALWISLD